MRKILGYIPLEKGEYPLESTNKDTHVIMIEDQWFKLAEVWIPGVDPTPNLYKQTHFRAIAQGQRCGNCAATKDRHTGPNLECPGKGDGLLPFSTGTKYD